MRRNPWRLTGAFVLTAAMASGNQARVRDAGWTAPSEDAARLNPLATRPDAAAGGRKVFRHRCAACHGAEGRGTPKGPDLSGQDVQARTDGALFWKISHGNTRTGMPAFSLLPEPQRWQLVLHIRAMTAAAP